MTVDFRRATSGNVLPLLLLIVGLIVLGLLAGGVFLYWSETGTDG